MTTEGENLRKQFDRLKREKGISRAAFAKMHKLKGGDAMIYQHINDLKPISLDAGLIYARGFGCRLSEISERLAKDAEAISSQFSGDTGERTSTQTVKWVDSVGEPISEWNDEADLNPEEFTIIPRFDITVSAGNGHLVTEERQKNKGQAYRVDWLKAMGLKGHDLKSISAKGDSMLPTFGDGCTLLVDFSHKQISEGKVYVIRFGDEIRVKRIHKRPDGGVIIRSDNRDAYPDINIPPEEMKNIEILGRVRHYSGEL